MPELPEVETISRLLQTTIVNQEVTDVEVLHPAIIRSGDLRNLTGWTITRVQRQGKYLVFNTDSKLCLFTHFGMSGLYLWQNDIDSEPTHVRAVIRFEKGNLLYNDVRRLKGIWVSENGKPPWHNLGMDALDENLTVSFLGESFSKTSRPIKNVLLDQSIIAGIGNIYASEILFHAGINPFRKTNTLSVQEVDVLRSSIKSVLLKAIEAGGTTLRDYKLSDGRDGEFQRLLKVYGKENESCPRCGSLIKRIVITQRATYLCGNPDCQK